MTEHDCTREEFDAWCDQLADLLMEYEPSLCDGTSADLHERTMEIQLYGHQVKLLLDELTLLAQYKASTEAAKRRAQDPEFIAEMRRRVRANVERDRELLNRLADS